MDVFEYMCNLFTGVTYRPRAISGQKAKGQAEVCKFYRGIWNGNDKPQRAPLQLTSGWKGTWWTLEVSLMALVYPSSPLGCARLVTRVQTSQGRGFRQLKKRACQTQALHRLLTGLAHQPNLSRRWRGGSWSRSRRFAWWLLQKTNGCWLILAAAALPSSLLENHECNRL